MQALLMLPQWDYGIVGLRNEGNESNEGHDGNDAKLAII